MLDCCLLPDPFKTTTWDSWITCYLIHWNRKACLLKITLMSHHVLIITASVWPSLFSSSKIVRGFIGDVEVIATVLNFFNWQTCCTSVIHQQSNVGIALLKDTFSQMEVGWSVQILPEFSNEGAIRMRKSVTLSNGVSYQLGSAGKSIARGPLCNKNKKH